MAGINVDFGARDNGLLSFFDKIKQESLKYTSSGREQLKYLNEQVALLERRNRLEIQSRQIDLDRTRSQQLDNSSGRYRKLDAISASDRQKFNSGEITRDEFVTRKKRISGLRDNLTDEEIEGRHSSNISALKEKERESRYQTALMREQIDTIKQTSNQEIVEGDKNAREFVDSVTRNPSAPSEEKIAANVVQEELTNRDRKNKGEEKESILTSIMQSENIKRVFSGVRGLSQSTSGFDSLKDVSQIAEGLGAGISSTIIDAILSVSGVSNPKIKAALSSMLSQAVGTAIGTGIEAMSRSMREREGLEAILNKNRAIAGTDVNTLDMSKMGYSFSEVANIQTGILRSSGRRSGLNNTENILGLERGYGVESGTSTQLLELLRSSKETDRDLSKIVGGVWDKGQGIFKGDRTFLDEFMSKNFAGLQKTLLQSGGSVSSGVTMDILSKFNGLGGEFAAQDPRSLGLVTGIHQALAAPGSDNMKSLSFMALRRMNPNMGIADLMMQQEQGLRSPGYLKSMLEFVDTMGGDDQMKRMNISKMFGVNQSAAKKIFENRGSLKSGNMDIKDLDGELDLSGEGERNTTKMQAFTASMLNQFTLGAIKGLTEAADQMNETIKLAFNGATYTVMADKSLQIKTNPTRTPVKKTP